MHDPKQFQETLIDYVEQNRLPKETLTFFQSNAPVLFDPGIILTDDYSPPDLLQGEG